MQSNYKLIRLVGVLALLLATYSQAQQSLITNKVLEDLRPSANAPSSEVPNFPTNDSPFPSLQAIKDDALCKIIIDLAELVIDNHSIGRKPAELIVLDNAVARNLLCPTVFGRPIRLMTFEQIQRANVVVYIEFESVILQNAQFATASYLLSCSKGCESRHFELELTMYEGFNNWAITKKKVTSITTEPTTTK